MIFKSAPLFSFKTQAEMVFACAALHNFLRKKCRSDEFCSDEDVKKMRIKLWKDMRIKLWKEMRIKLWTKVVLKKILRLKNKKEKTQGNGEQP